MGRSILNIRKLNDLISDGDYGIDFRFVKVAKYHLADEKVEALLKKVARDESIKAFGIYGIFSKEIDFIMKLFKKVPTPKPLSKLDPTKPFFDENVPGDTYVAQSNFYEITRIAEVMNYHGYTQKKAPPNESFVESVKAEEGFPQSAEEYESKHFIKIFIRIRLKPEEKATAEVFNRVCHYADKEAYIQNFWLSENKEVMLLEGSFPAACYYELDRVTTNLDNLTAESWDKETLLVANVFHEDIIGLETYKEEHIAKIEGFVAEYEKDSIKSVEDREGQPASQVHEVANSALRFKDFLEFAERSKKNIQASQNFEKIDELFKAVKDRYDKTTQRNE